MKGAFLRVSNRSMAQAICRALWLINFAALGEKCLATTQRPLPPIRKTIPSALSPLSPTPKNPIEKVFLF